MDTLQIDDRLFILKINPKIIDNLLYEVEEVVITGVSKGSLNYNTYYLENKFGEKKGLVHSRKINRVPTPNLIQLGVSFYFSSLTLLDQNLEIIHEALLNRYSTLRSLFIEVLDPKSSMEGLKTVKPLYEHISDILYYGSRLLENSDEVKGEVSLEIVLDFSVDDSIELHLEIVSTEIATDSEIHSILDRDPHYGFFREVLDNKNIRMLRVYFYDVNVLDEPKYHDYFQVSKSNTCKEHTYNKDALILLKKYIPFTSETKYKDIIEEIKRMHVENFEELKPLFVFIDNISKNLSMKNSYQLLNQVFFD